MLEITRNMTPANVGTWFFFDREEEKHFYLEDLTEKQDSGLSWWCCCGQRGNAIYRDDIDKDNDVVCDIPTSS